MESLKKKVLYFLVIYIHLQLQMFWITSGVKQNADSVIVKYATKKTISKMTATTTLAMEYILSHL